MSRSPIILSILSVALVCVLLIIVDICTISSGGDIRAITRNGDTIDPYQPSDITRYDNIREIPLQLMCTHNSKKCPKPAGSHICCRTHLREMIAALGDIMESRLFMTNETVLSAISCGDMALDADVITLAVTEEDEPFLKQALDRLNSLGHETELARERIRYNTQNNHVIIHPPRRYYTVKYDNKNLVSIEISVLSRVALDGVPVLVDFPNDWALQLQHMPPDERELYKGWFVYESDVIPPRKVTFMNSSFHAPANPTNYLNHLYGKGWGNDIICPVVTYLRKTSSVPYSPHKVKAYIINMDRDIERLHHCLGQFDEEGIHAVKVENCCAPDNINHRWLRFSSASSDNRTRDLLEWKLSNAEKNVCMSHVLCWEKAMGESTPVIIVEDDVSLPYDFRDVLSSLLQELEQGQKDGVIPSAAVIRLGYTSNKPLASTVLENGRYLYHGPFSAGAWAYILTPAAAEILVTMTHDEPIIHPLDHIFNIPHPSSGDANRKIYKHSYDPHYLDQRDYMFMEATYPNLRFRYEMYNDKYRVNQIVQEISTAISASRSGIGI